MRYFALQVSDASGNIYYPQANGSGFTVTDDVAQMTYTSLYPNASVYTVGGGNPAALRCEMDITVTGLHIPAAEAKPFVKIHGISRGEIAQASDLNGKFIKVYGGMSKGLPLENPAQAGLLCSGQIMQAFGNWLGTEQNINFYLTASSSAPNNTKTVAGTSASPALTPVTQSSPANIIFQWNKGQPLMSAIANTLQNAFPQLSVQGAVNAGLVWTSGQAKTGYFQTLQQFAEFIRQMSIPLIAGPYAGSNVYAPSGNPTYTGVIMTLQGSVIYVTDFSTATSPKQIAFQDLIGQPTWSQPGKIQVTCVMRNDFNISDFIQIPPDIFTISSGAATFAGLQVNNTTSAQANGSVFSGIYTLTNIRHVGDSRQAGKEGAAAWVTVLDLTAAPQTVTNAPAPQAALPYVYKSSSNNSYGFTT